MPLLSAPPSLLSRLLTYFSQRASLRAALSAAYLLQMGLAIALSAGLAWRAIDRTGLHLARQQQATIAQQVGDRLREDLQRLEEIDRAARDAVTLGLWSESSANPENPENSDGNNPATSPETSQNNGLSVWLWQQARARQLQAIGVRERQGRTVTIVRQSDDTLVSIELEAPWATPVAHRLDDSGQHLEPIALDAVERLAPSLRLFDRADAAPLPIVRFMLPDSTEREANAAAIVATVLPTDELGHLLDRLYVGERGAIAAIDPDGNLLASSGQSPQPESMTALDMLDATDPLATPTIEMEMHPILERAIATVLPDEAQSATSATSIVFDTPQQREIRIDGWRYQVSLSPVELSPGRTIWIVSALANRDFGQVGYSDLLSFVAIGALATAIVGTINLLKGRATIRSIAQLKTAIDALAQQRWSDIELSKQSSEFRRVNASVVRAARRLRDEFESLRDRSISPDRGDPFQSDVFEGSIQQLNALQAQADRSDADCRKLTKTARQTLALLENAAELYHLEHEAHADAYEPVVLDTCLDLVIDRHQSELEARQLKLIRRDAPTPIFVCADPTKLERVLHELLENAIQFSHDGGTIFISVAIAVSAVRSSYHDLPEVSISIADNGVGIDPAEQHKLFQPFSRISHHDAKRCGYGLGLAIADRTMTLFGGRLEIQSDGCDRGTVARMTLPVAPTQETIGSGDWDSVGSSREFPVSEETDLPFV